MGAERRGREGMPMDQQFLMTGWRIVIETDVKGGGRGRKGVDLVVDADISSIAFFDVHETGHYELEQINLRIESN